MNIYQSCAKKTQEKTRTQTKKKTTTFKLACIQTNNAKRNEAPLKTGKYWKERTGVLTIHHGVHKTLTHTTLNTYIEIVYYILIMYPLCTYKLL